MERQSYGEQAFRRALALDPMASTKLTEGIEIFSADIEKLEALLARRS
jgi:transaldolase